MGFAPPPHSGFAFIASARMRQPAGIFSGWVAGPSLVGSEVAVLRPHVGFSYHVTKATYSFLRGVYVRHGTKHDKSQGIPTSVEVLEDICPLESLVATPRTIQIIDTDVATGGGRGSPGPMPTGVGLSGKECYRELRRITLPRTPLNRPSSQVVSIPLR